MIKCHSHIPLYGIEIIKEILPHRSPFLFVDRVMELETGERIIAEKDLSPDEWYFAGHFPGRPILPGVLVSEALAQASGFLLGFTWKGVDATSVQTKRGLFLANVNIKFISPVKPGEVLLLASILKKEYGGMFLFHVEASVGDLKIAGGTLILSKEG
jgi:3-hydroxyacyl-[acyl-carrier-protein] dehydratase